MHYNIKVLKKLLVTVHTYTMYINQGKNKPFLLIPNFLLKRVYITTEWLKLLQQAFLCK